MDYIRTYFNQVSKIKLEYEKVIMDMSQDKDLSDKVQHYVNKHQGDPSTIGNIDPKADEMSKFAKK